MRYFIAFMVALGLFFVVVFLLFRGGDQPKKQPTVRTLNSYAATSAETQMTIDGPINSAEEHQAARITVDQNNVTYEQLTGYNGNVVRIEQFANSQSAYYAFLSALAHAGFTRGDKNPALANEAGYCPQSNRYVFSLRQDGQDIERYWTSDCGSPKTYKGAQALTIGLFKAQVPGYSNLANQFGL